MQQLYPYLVMLWKNQSYRFKNSNYYLAREVLNIPEQDSVVWSDGYDDTWILKFTGGECLETENMF